MFYYYLIQVHLEFHDSKIYSYTDAWLDSLFWEKILFKLHY